MAHLTMQDAINEKISNAAEFITFQIGQGIDRERAIQMMSDMSTLGTKSWEKVLDLVEDPENRFIVSL